MQINVRWVRSPLSAVMGRSWVGDARKTERGRNDLLRLLAIDSVLAFLHNWQLLFASSAIDCRFIYMLTLVIRLQRGDIAIYCSSQWKRRPQKYSTHSDNCKHILLSWIVLFYYCLLHGAYHIASFWSWPDFPMLSHLLENVCAWGLSLIQGDDPQLMTYSWLERPRPPGLLQLWTQCCWRVLCIHINPFSVHKPVNTQTPKTNLWPAWSVTHLLLSHLLPIAQRWMIILSTPAPHTH